MSATSRARRPHSLHRFREICRTMVGSLIASSAASRNALLSTMMVPDLAQEATGPCGIEDLLSEHLHRDELTRFRITRGIDNRGGPATNFALDREAVREHTADVVGVRHIRLCRRGWALRHYKP